MSEPAGRSGAPVRRPESPDRRAGHGDPDTARHLGELAGLGLTLGLATALFAWLGSLLDEWLGTSPAFVLLGTFVGFGGGFYSVYARLVLKPRADRRDESRPDAD